MNETHTRGNTIENWEYLIIYMFGRTCNYFGTLTFFFVCVCVFLVVDLIPYSTKQNAY